MSLRQWWAARGALPDREREARLACAALLLEIARSDACIDAAEEAAVAALLAECWQLDAAAVAALMDEALATVERAVSLREFTRVLVETLSVEERGRIVDLLWQVAHADGRIDRYEDHTVRKLADLLYVSHRRFVQAKLRAAGEID